MDPEIEFFDQHFSPLNGIYWTWVAVRGDVGVAVLTARPIGLGNARRAVVGMIYSEQRGAGSCLVMEAIRYLADEQKLTLYRTGKATAAGAALFQKFGVGIDYDAQRRQQEYPARRAEWERKNALGLTMADPPEPPIGPYEPGEADYVGKENLAQANCLLRKRDSANQA